MSIPVPPRPDPTTPARAEPAERPGAGEERRLRRVLDGLFAFVGVLAPDGALVEANRAPVEASGLTHADVLGRPFWECWWWAWDPAVQARVRDACARAARGETVRHDTDVRVADVDGRRQVVTIDLQVAPLRDEAGRIAHLIASAVDVTARTRATAALAASEARFRAALQATSDIVWTNDPEGRMLGEQRDWAAFTGQAFAAYQGYGWATAVHPDDAAPTIAAWERAVAARGPFVFEHRVRRHDGAYRRCTIRAVPVLDGAGAIREWVGVHRDVTEERDAQAAERAAREAAEAARARAEAASRAKSAFLATMSHELRTPLNAIAGHLQLVELGLHGPVTDAQREALGRAARAQRHLLALIDDVLNYATLETGKVEYRVRPCAIDAAIRDVLPLVELQAAARGLTLDVALPDAGCRVLADPEKLGQVLLNLLANAVKFTPTGGRVAVTVCTRADGPAADPGAVYVRVADTGIGIAPEALDRVFEPFVQVHVGSNPLTRPHEGSGLGLAIARDLAHGMGGELRVRSAVGRGSAFTLTLRRAD